MQIKISKDIGACFDELSILSVKWHKCQNNNISYDINNLVQLKEEIIEAIGIELFYKIMDSQEYDDLYNINREIFELVDALREITYQRPTNWNSLANYGIGIDLNNTKRYEAKKAIQKKFLNQ